MPSPADGPLNRPTLATWLVWGGWLALMIGFSVSPIRIELKDPDSYRNKDYDIWYDTARTIWEGGEIYPQVPNADFPFMYPPPAAIYLAGLAGFGKLAFVILLDVLNSCAWVICFVLGLWMLRGRATHVPPMLVLVPFVGTIAYVSDMYLLGQPNLLLLAVMLGAMLSLHRGFPVLAGCLIAFAASVKAFPVTALCYLIWRRNWKATAAMLVSLAFLMVLLPLPWRGWERHSRDLVTWTQGMLFNYNSTTIGQRPDITYRWKNQSLIGTTHRLLRKVPADDITRRMEGDTAVTYPVFANFAELSFEQVNQVILGVALALCLFYVAVMPPRHLRTAQTDAAEFSMLLILMTIFSPISWFYYGVWLLFPLMAVTDCILEMPRGSRARYVAIAGLAVCFVLLDFVPPWKSYRSIRAVGTPLFGYLLLFFELGWLLVRHRLAANAGAVTTSTSTTNLA